MKDEEWADWVSYHGKLHRMSDKSDVEMMDLWRPVFEADHAGLQELKIASMAISGKTWRTEHLETLLANVRARRLAEQQRAEEAARMAQREIPCVECHNSGLVEVIHPQSMKDGRWVWPHYTAVVACRCSIGAVKLTQNQATRAQWDDEESSGKKHKTGRKVAALVTLDEYEKNFPTWKAMQIDREAKRLAEQTARSATKHADKTRGKLADPVKQIIERIKQRQGS